MNLASHPVGREEVGILLVKLTEVLGGLEKDGDAHWKCWMKLLKDTNLGVAL